jgi:DNA repair exonuclease SbcCD ATPase subunit
MNKIIFLLLLILFVTPLSSQSKKENYSNKEMLFKIDSLFEAKEKRIDSLYNELKEVNKGIQNDYQEILEKTNQQLSVWTNPYGMLIGVLAILFTLLTIIATVLIFLQSKGFKEKLDKFINSGKEALEKLITEKSKKLEEIDTKLEGYKAELNKVKDDKKAEIQKEIDELISKRKNITSELATTVEAFPASGSIYTTRRESHHQCTKCGFGFMVVKPDAYASLSGSLIQQYAAKCPNCGNIDTISYLY